MTNELLPVIFVVLMGVAMLAYVVLDGYDLGVGMLLRQADEGQKNVMISSIGPFWDANETWLVWVLVFAHGFSVGTWDYFGGAVFACSLDAAGADPAWCGI